MNNHASGKLNFGQKKSLKAKTVTRWYLHVWLPPWSVEEVEVWWRGGALLLILFNIYSEFQACLKSKTTTNTLHLHTIPSGLGHHLLTNSVMTHKHTPPGFVRTVWPDRSVSDDLASTVTQPESSWEHLGWMKEEQPTSSQRVWEFHGKPF